MACGKTHLITLLCTAVILAMPLPPAAQSPLPELVLKAGGHRISAEVAATLSSRELGLMNRSSLPADSGMLFVFPEDHPYCMWMHDTLIPLSVAFLDDKGTIVTIADMLPRTDDTHCAAGPVRYALEMNLGWFRKNGVRPGARISGLEKAPQGR